MAAKKLTRNAAIIAAIRKGFGPSAALSLEEERAAAQITEFIPTGIDVLDRYVLGNGGLAVGRMSEVFGPNGCGKTSLMYAALAGVQSQGGIAVAVDGEYSFDEDRARMFGVDTDDLIIVQPMHLEDLFSQLKVILATHNPKDGHMLIGWDSIACMKTKAGLEAKVGDKTPAEVARLMSDELPKLLKGLHAKHAHLMMLNQIRAKFGGGYGDNVTTPGGNAPGFYASTRLQFFGGKAVKNAYEEHVAKVVTIMSIKNRMAPPYRKARVRYDYASGFNNLWSTLEHAKRFEVINPREERFKGKGKFSVENYKEAFAALGWDAGAGSAGNSGRAGPSGGGVDDDEADEPDEDLDDADDSADPDDDGDGDEDG